MSLSHSESGFQPTILDGQAAQEEGLVAAQEEGLVEAQEEGLEAAVFDEDPDVTLEGYTFQAYLGQGVLTKNQLEGKHKAPQLQVGL